jgi:hypothetical protein
MYGGPWVVGSGMAALALVISISLAVRGGAAPATGVWKLLINVSWASIPAGAGVSLLGALLRPMTARRVTRFCRDRDVLNLPPLPRPQVGERFGHHRVHLSDRDELLLGQQRFAAVRELARALGLGGFVGIIILAQVVLISGLAWQILAVAANLGAVGAWLGAIATPVPVHWLATSADGEPRLSIEYAQLIFRRFTRDISGPQIVKLYVAEGKLSVILRDGGHVLLATVGFGAAGRWRSRRIGCAVRRIVGAPGRIRFENEDVIERLPV